MTNQQYACIFHPSKPATAQCYRCGKFMCSEDTKVLVSTNYFISGPHFIHKRKVYCIPCLRHQFDFNNRLQKIFFGAWILLLILLFPIFIAILLSDLIEYGFMLFAYFGLLALLISEYKDKKTTEQKEQAYEEAKRFSESIESVEIKKLYQFTD